MMIKAFGPSGIEGNFRIVCENTMKVIRSHRESIMTVLDIFLQVPLEGTDFGDEKRTHSVPEASSNKISQYEVSNASTLDDGIEISSILNIKKAISRVSDKITGKDFSEFEELTIEDQIRKLIVSATDNYHLAHTFHGWTPLW